MCKSLLLLFHIEKYNCYRELLETVVKGDYVISTAACIVLNIELVSSGYVLLFLSVHSDPYFIQPALNLIRR